MTTKFEQYIRWDFLGLSTDTKPTPTTSENVTDGSTYFEVDTSKLYVWCQDDWYEKQSTGGGGGGSTPQIKTLTSADNNYPIDNPTRICLGLLPQGIYTSDGSTQVCLGTKTTQNQRIQTGEIAIVSPRLDNSGSVNIYIIRETYGITTCIGNSTTGAASNIKFLPTEVVNNLTSIDTEAALSAAQGKVLNDKINAVKCQLNYDPQTNLISTVQTAAQLKALMDAGIALVPFTYVGDNTYMQGGIVHVSFSSTEPSVFLLYVYDGVTQQFIIINMTAATLSDVFSGIVGS